LKFCGVIHSHPDSMPYPSQPDQQAMISLLKHNRELNFVIAPIVTFTRNQNAPFQSHELNCKELRFSFFYLTRGRNEVLRASRVNYISPKSLFVVESHSRELVPVQTPQLQPNLPNLPRPDSKIPPDCYDFAVITIRKLERTLSVETEYRGAMEIVGNPSQGGTWYYVWLVTLKRRETLMMLFGLDYPDNPPKLSSEKNGELLVSKWKHGRANFLENLQYLTLEALYKNPQQQQGFSSKPNQLCNQFAPVDHEKYQPANFEIGIASTALPYEPELMKGSRPVYEDKQHMRNAHVAAIFALRASTLTTFCAVLEKSGKLPGWKFARFLLPVSKEWRKAEDGEVDIIGAQNASRLQSDQVLPIEKLESGYELEILHQKLKDCSFALVVYDESNPKHAIGLINCLKQCFPLGEITKVTDTQFQEQGLAMMDRVLQTLVEKSHR